MTLRVTPRSAQRVAIDGLGANLGRMSKLQEQLASGKLLNRPSDAPISTISAMQYRSDIRRSEQFMRNADDGLNWLGIADDTLTRMLDITNHARGLVIRGKNSSMGASERSNIAAEMHALKDMLVGLANTKYLDRPIFAGNAQTQSAYAADGSFLGSAGDAVERRVGPNTKVRVNVTGPEIFGTDGLDDGNLFELIGKIADDLVNDPTALDADLSKMDARVLAFQNRLGEVGARYHQVQGMRERADQTQVTMKNGLSEVESVDLPKAIMELQLQEVAYRSALSATARVIQPSLMDFLR